MPDLNQIMDLLGFSLRQHFVMATGAGQALLQLLLAWLGAQEERDDLL